MSRWRLGLAITLTIVAIPLWIQAGEPDASAGAEKLDAPGDPNARGYTLLADRAAAWSDLRTSVADAQVEAARAAEEAAAAAAAAATTTTTTTRAAITTAKPTTTVPTTKAPTTTKPPTTTAKPTTTVTTTRPPTTTAVPAPPAGPPRALPAGTTPEMWLQLRTCESGNNYHSSSSGGAYRGAYQFSQATWNTIAASSSSLSRLVGVDPATAAPVDQDSMAYTLYELRGKSPWPLCGTQLP